MTDNTMSYGITGFGAYIPRLRLERAAIASAHRWMAPSKRGKGVRAYASWDEDAITMAVEAGRSCIPPSERQDVRSLTLVSTTLPYADLQNSAIVSTALSLGRQTQTSDVCASQRAATTELIRAFQVERPGALLIASDRLRAKIASLQEMSYGAGAAAVTLGSEGVLARYLGSSSVVEMFSDHFRLASASYDYYWEERWIRDEGYSKIVKSAVTDALAQANVKIDSIDWLVVQSPISGNAEVVAKTLGFSGKIARNLDDGCGYCGAAHVLLMLVDTLEQARPGERILIAGFGQGADAVIIEVTDNIIGAQGARKVQQALDQRITSGDYMRMLSHYGEIDVDWGMRSEISTRATITEVYRSASQVLAFNAGKCGRCGTVQFPTLPYCVNPVCNAPKSEFAIYPLADAPAKVMTFTADWLSYYLGPPLYAGFVQFDVGARILLEMVDVGSSGLRVGLPVESVFRIKEADAVRGFNRYFWKVRPITI